MFTDRWIDKQNVACHTMEYYSALRGKEILTDVTTWMKPILYEVSQTQKNKYWWFHLYEVPRAVQSIEIASRMVVVRGREEVGRMRQLLFDGYKFYFGTMRMFWRWTVVIAAQQCEYAWCHSTVHLKMVETVNAVLCLFYILKKHCNSLFYIFMYFIFNLSRSLT